MFHVKWVAKQNIFRVAGKSDIMWTGGTVVLPYLEKLISRGFYVELFFLEAEVLSNMKLN